MEDQPPGRRGRVDVLFEDDQADAAFAQLVGQREQVLQRRIPAAVTAAWNQNSRTAWGPRIRSPIPGSGGDSTSALTRSGRARAIAWAVLLPMS